MEQTLRIVQSPLIMKKSIAFISVMLLISQMMLQCICAGTESLDAAAEVLCVQQEEFLFEEGSEHTWTFNVSTKASYEIYVTYKAVKDKSVLPQIGLSFDKDYSESDGVVSEMPRLWRNDLSGERFSQDDLGNERLPGQVEVEEWQTIKLKFNASDVKKDNSTELLPGTHKLCAKMIRQSVTISKLYLLPKSESVKYFDYKAMQDEKGIKDTLDISKSYEAELTYYKSHPEIVVSYDRTTPSITPNDPSKIRYNILGGEGYSREGQWVSWQIDAPQSGYYALDFLYRQNINQGLDVRRRLYVDDKILFNECNEVVFPYSENFTTRTLSDKENKPYKIYLDKGKHTLKLEVTLGTMEPVLQELEQVVKLLNRMYTKIIVIVGEKPDSYRDYDLDKHIDGLLETFEDCATRLDGIVVKLNSANGENSSNTARISEVSRNLRVLASKPRKIPVNQDLLRSQINTLADMMANMRTQPLELDSLAIRSPESPEVKPHTGFIEMVKFKVEAFINSFLNDYSSIGKSQNEKAKVINVWVSTNDPATVGFGTGRDQAQIITQLIQDSFTPNSSISVNLSLMDSGTLMQALVSGKGPDAAMFLSELVLSNLYFRNALVDLKTMKEYEEIEKRFYPSALVALKSGNKTFAFPEVQSYNMLFYRTDILDEYGLNPPETWQEFYTLLSELQKLGMQIGVAESQQIYEMMLLQKGGKIYTEDMANTCLTSEESVNAFAEWTDLYTRHSVPVSFDGLNRFRTGQLPVIISPVSFYSSLEIGAPEIHNQWKMVPIPGTKKEDGTIDKSQSCNVTGVAVMADSDKRDEAFSLVEWWTRTETQNRFAFECDTRIGVSARYYPANIETLSHMAWTKSEYDVLAKQRALLDDVPQSPATYFLTRNLSNAFRRVVYAYENPRDVIYRYGREVDSELTRKRQELKLSKGGE